MDSKTKNLIATFISIAAVIIAIVIMVLWFGKRHHLWIPKSAMETKIVPTEQQTQYDDMVTQLKQCQARDFLILLDNTIVYTRSGYDSTNELIAYGRLGQIIAEMRNLDYLTKEIKLIIKRDTPEAGRVAELFLAKEKYTPQKTTKDPEGIWKYR